MLAVAAFLALIIIHEFGHFIAAKAMGVRVNEFAVGFGPKLFSRKKGETEYKINLIPLGGYCAMEGENEASEDGRAFCNKKPWQRLIIVAAGAVFNLILGVVLVGVSLIPSDRFATKTIAKFADNSVSSKYGLKAGDEILSVNGRRVFTTYDMSYTFTGIDDGTVDLTVLRDGERVDLKDVKFATEEVDGINYLSVDFWVYGEEKTFTSFVSQSLKMTVSYARVVWFSLLDLITGKFGLNALSGPVGITAVVGNAAKQNINNLWPIMALITINLGIFNLLPFPALDGGRIFTIIIEMIFRKRVPEKVEATINTVGFAILFVFMIIVMASDIFKLVTG
ncbi:MAG: site-2 protease family protein [Clostridiales bacterium]|nr:site-2 protease family protein [Candidatus Equinaster intestinalis]